MASHIQVMRVTRILLLISFCLLTFGVTLFGQSKYVTENGQIDFTSNAELELIKATSSKVRGILDPSNNQIAFVIDVLSFTGFNSSLQREHFLEKYMEVHNYPKAEFSGKIIEHVDFLADGAYDVRVKGTLDIHGQKQIRIIKGKIIVKKGQVRIETDFVIPLTDHNISIPSIVNRKIATEIDVSFKATLTANE